MLSFFGYIMVHHRTLTPIVEISNIDHLTTVQNSTANTLILAFLMMALETKLSALNTHSNNNGFPSKTMYAATPQNLWECGKHFFKY